MLSWGPGQIVIIYVPRACTKKNLESITPIFLVSGHILLVFVFWALFWPFLTPFMPTSELKVPIGTLNPSFIIWAENQTKKEPYISILFSSFNFSPLEVILWWKNAPNWPLLIVILHRDCKNQKTKNIRHFQIAIFRDGRSWKCKICFRFPKLLLLTHKMFFFQNYCFCYFRVCKILKTW